MLNPLYVRTEVEETSGIGFIILDFPPVNALSGRNYVPQSIGRAVDEFDVDDRVQIIAIYSTGRLFSAGADISEFGEDSAQDVVPLRSLFASMDAVSKPILCAMHGLAFGGGLELALCADYRIARSETKFGFPEVSLGLLPGGGGTQRTPRLVGMEIAIDLVTSGRTIPAQEALDYGLLDEIFEGDIRHAAVSFVEQLADQKSQRHRPRDMSLPAFSSGQIDLARLNLTKASGRNPGPLRALDCLQQAGKGSFDETLSFEYEAFDELMENPHTQGLCHAFLSERAAVKVPHLAGQRADRTIETVALVGAGTMGIGIALACLKAGLDIVLIDQNAEAIVGAENSVASQLARQVDRGRLSEDQRDAQLARLTLSSDYEAAGSADLIVEAVFEDLDVKKSVFKILDSVAKTDCVLATNTSTLDVDQIAAATDRPESVVGMHFFSPANIMKLLEIVNAEKTDDRTLLLATQFAKQIGKVGVTVGVCDGFVGNRIMEEYLRQIYFMLEEGALPNGLDLALEEWGWAMGGCKVMDLAGQDIGWAIRKRRAIEQPSRPYSKIPDLLCEQEWFGRKSGRGYYLYPEGSRETVADPTVEAMIVAHSESIGIQRRQIGSDEIVERTLLAMINEGARILDEGVAFRPLDIDVIYLNGYGFARDRGGPMFQADSLGLDHVIERLEHFNSQRSNLSLQPAELLYRMQKQGLRFKDLNEGARAEGNT